MTIFFTTINLHDQFDHPILVISANALKQHTMYLDRRDMKTLACEVAMDLGGKFEENFGNQNAIFCIHSLRSLSQVTLNAIDILQSK